MMYRLADLQVKGRYFASGAVFPDKMSVICQLVDFLEQDCEEDLREKVLSFNTKEEQLQFLLDIGQFELEPINIKNKNISDYHTRKKAIKIIQLIEESVNLSLFQDEGYYNLEDNIVKILERGE